MSTATRRPARLTARAFRHAALHSALQHLWIRNVLRFTPRKREDVAERVAEVQLVVAGLDITQVRCTHCVGQREQRMRA